MSETSQAVIPANQYPRGWYPDVNQPGWLRWWDGQQWTEHTQQDSIGIGQRTPVAVAYGNQAPVQQVIVHSDRKRVNHVLHFFLTLITAGLWLPVWIILAISNS